MPDDYNKVWGYHNFTLARFGPVDWQLNEFMLIRHEQLPPSDDGSWALCMVECEVREETTRSTVEDLVDLLQGLVDVGRLNPDDVVRDIVYHNGRRKVRFWRRASGAQT